MAAMAAMADPPGGLGAAAATHHLARRPRFPARLQHLQALLAELQTVGGGAPKNHCGWLRLVKQKNHWLVKAKVQRMLTYVKAS